MDRPVLRQENRAEIITQPPLMRELRGVVYDAEDEGGKTRRAIGVLLLRFLETVLPRFPSNPSHRTRYLTEH